MTDTMPMPSATAPLEEAGSGVSTVRDYVSLLKPRVMTLVVFSGWVGLAIAPSAMHPFLQAVALLCIAVGSGASAAFNMWYDRDIDRIMTRTQKRPLPRGLISEDDCLTLASVLALGSVVLLGLAANWLSAALLLSAILFYVGIYTMWLKRRTPQNIVIGGAAGAFPPVIGWAAATGSIGLEPLLIFAIVFFWTPPHFWALALYRNRDYTLAGVPMMPVIAGMRSTKRQMLFYTLLLAAISILPWILGMTGAIYGTGAVILNLLFIAHAIRVLQSEDDRPAMRMFGFSILYLFILLGLWPIDMWIDSNLLHTLQ